MSKVAACDSNPWPDLLVNRTCLRQAGYQQRWASSKPQLNGRVELNSTV